MENFQAKGTGNSRLLKSVPNFLALYPTYQAFARALIDGTFPFDNNGINPAGVNVTGTPYAKATVLPDDLARAYNLDPKTANIASVLQVLTAVAVFGKDGNITNLSGDDNVGPVWTNAYAAPGSYPATYSVPFKPRFAILWGWATGNQRCITLVRGGSGDAISMVGTSGLVTNFKARISGSGITISGDPGSSIAGANNVSGKWEYIIAFR